MTTKEMYRRLAELTTDQTGEIIRLIKEGWGEQSIRIEVGVPLRLIRAVFVKEQMGSNDKPHTV